MAQYNEYRESGIPWIGKVPSHWEVKTLRAFLEATSDKGHSEMPLLSVTREKGILPRGAKGDDDNNNVIPEDLSNYKLVNRGDFVINKMKSWQGSYGLSEYDGIVSPAYFTYKLSFKNKQFFSLALRSKAYIPFFMQFSKGIRVDQWDLKPNAIKEIPFFIPPADEQVGIVAYLDKVTADIDKAIAAKERIISALEERRKIIITEAVTRGINPDTPLRDSGIDWLGHIPAHWKISKIKYVTDNLDYLRIPITADQRSRNNPQYDYYGASGVIDKIDFYCVNDRVLLIGEDGANLLLRNLPLVYKADGKFWVNNHAHILKEKIGCDYDYLAYLLESIDYTIYITGSAQPKLSQSNLGRVPLYVPPFEEQVEIRDFIDRNLIPIDTAIARQRKAIELLRERKSIIINEVVTGKIKVV